MYTKQSYFINIDYSNFCNEKLHDYKNARYVMDIKNLWAKNDDVAK